MTPIEPPSTPSAADRQALADKLGAFSTPLRPAPVPGVPSGPLAGLTLAVKDNLDVAGLPTGGGARTPLAACASRTATAVQRLLDAGMTLAGKTRMSELAFGGWGTNAATGCPRNPWDARVVRVPGGSSSGSAVAVAAGLADAALGTDTGGSVRIPASLCGLTAIRPRHGLVGRAGLHGLAPSLDVIGPMAWNIATAARLLQAMAGPDAADPESGASPGFDAVGALARSPASLRAAVPPPDALGDLEPDVAEAFAAAVAVLRGLVAELRTVAPPMPFDAYVEPLGAILGHEAWHLHGARAEAHGREMDPWVLRRLRGGAGIGDAAYRAALAERSAAQAAFRARLAGFDLLITPATPIAAPPLAAVDEAALPLSRFTRAFSYLDLAAVALPCGATAEGLPVGLQIVGLYGEADAVALAAVYQAATGWHRRRPDLSGFASA